MPQDDDDIKRLTSLRWRETSGVDHPANEEEGWVVMKNAEGLSDEDLERELEELIEEETELSKASQDLVRVLEDAKGYLSDAPREVRSALQTLLTYMKEEYGYGYGYATPDEKEKKRYPTLKDLAGVLRRAMARLTVKSDGQEPHDFVKALADEWPAFEQEVARIVSGNASADDKRAELAKAVGALREKVAPK
jgi:hypothetical protein